jgi:hypothetical protein
MKTNVGIGAVITLLLVCLTGLCGWGQAQKGENKLMREKLKNAQGVLEGLALNDFKKIVKHGEELIQISKNAEWQAIKSPRYELYSNEFRRAIEAMIEKSEAKNLDGAALSYVEMTLSCVKCHKYVRDTRMTRLDKPVRWQGIVDVDK